MREKLKNLFESWTQSFTYDAIKAILVIVFSSGFSSTGAYVFLREQGLPWWHLTILCISIAALFSFGVLLIVQGISNHYTPSDKIESNYEILEKTVALRYDGTKSYYNAEIKLLFKQKTREYYGKFYWSGSGDGRIKPINKNYRLNELKRRNRYIEYVVIFDRAYKKGQKLTLKLTGEMDDPEKKFSPYFATTVNDPTRRLRIVLQIDPQKYPIEDLEQDIVPPTRGGHEDCCSVCLDESGVYTWEIKNPVLTYQYSLNWVFKT